MKLTQISTTTSTSTIYTATTSTISQATTVTLGQIQHRELSPEFSTPKVEPLETSTLNPRSPDHGVGKRQATNSMTTKQLPTYASACQPSQYVSACACLSIQPSTITLPGSTASAVQTTIVTSTATTTVVTKTLTACANPTPTFHLQSTSGYGVGQYAYEANNYGYVQGLTPDVSSAASFYLLSNGDIYNPRNGYSVIGSATGYAGSLFFQTAPASEFGAYAVNCILAAGGSGTITCHDGNGGSQFQYCGNDGGPDQLTSIVLDATVDAGCDALTFVAVPVCTVIS